ncbi:hypothetical protein [Alkaliphilus transvaalensis]|nr:hypothetical protein [Alkaliphilus transvaalensis]
MAYITLVNGILNRLPIFSKTAMLVLTKGLVCPKFNSNLLKGSTLSYT